MKILKKFQAKATLKYRHNHISVLQDESGNEFTEHTAKATILRAAFKERLGQSNSTSNPLYLQDLLTRRDDLQCLEEPFSKQEIDAVIKEMPTNKAPGPDGFNGNFIKACWHIISADFYKLIEDFHQGNCQLESINASYITLIPKKDVPINANDFRPISLLNCSIKIITKLLANRLQKVILNLVHPH